MTPETRNPRQRGVAIKLLLGVVLIGVVGGGAYLVYRPVNTGGAALATIHTVERRSFPLVLEEKGTLKAAKSTNIMCDIEGEAKILKLVPEGDTVKEGDFLIEFAKDKLEEQLQQERAQENEAQNALVRSKTEHETHVHESGKKIRAAERELTQAKLDLEKYQQADWPQAKADAEVAVKNAEDEHKRSSEKLAASEKLREKKYISGPDLLDDQIAFRKAEAELEKAKLALESLINFTRPKDLAEKEAAVRDAEEELTFVTKSAEDTGKQKLADIEAKQLALDLVQQQIKKIEDQLTRTTITAPGPGIVVYGNADQPWMREEIGEGKTVWKGTVVMQLPDLTKMHAVARVHESKTEKIHPEDHVEVSPEGAGDTSYSGKVLKIAALPDSGNRWLNPEVKEYDVEVAIDAESPPLRPGGTAKVRIFVGQVEDALAVPVQSVFGKGRRNYVFRDAGLTTEPVEITLGQANDQFVEVVKGLVEGDRIRMAVDDGTLARLPEPDPNEKPEFGPRGGKRRGPGGGEKFAGKGGEKKPGGEGEPAAGDLPGGAAESGPKKDETAPVVEASELKDTREKVATEAGEKKEETTPTPAESSTDSGTSTQGV